jgi:hypothetical protein
VIETGRPGPELVRPTPHTAFAEVSGIVETFSTMATHADHRAVDDASAGCPIPGAASNQEQDNPLVTSSTVQWPRRTPEWLIFPKMK